MTLFELLSDLEELSRAAEGSCWKVVCFGETIELRLKSMIFRVGSKPPDSSFENRWLSLDLGLFFYSNGMWRVKPAFCAHRRLLLIRYERVQPGTCLPYVFIGLCKILYV